MTRFLFFCKSLRLWRKPTADRWTQSAACKQNGSHSLHFWGEDFFLALSVAEGAAITSVEWGGWCRWIPVAHKELPVSYNRGGLARHNLSGLVKVAFSSSSSNLLVSLNCSHYAPQRQSSVGAWLLHKLILMTVCVTRLSGSIWGGSETGQPALFTLNISLRYQFSPLRLRQWRHTLISHLPAMMGPVVSVLCHRTPCHLYLLGCSLCVLMSQ